MDFCGCLWVDSWIFVGGFLEAEHDGFFLQGISMNTLPETNIAPENGPLEKEIPIGNHHLQVPC